jgi:hypothetical protein
MNAETWNTTQVFIAGIATLAIFSFLIKENPFYRFFEHLFIGIASGLSVIITLKNFLWPKILVPMLGYDIQRFPDGTLSKPYNAWVVLYVIPMLFGLLYYFLYSRRYAWLAKIVIGFTLGWSAGLAFKGFFNQMLPQLIMSFKPLLVFSGGTLDSWQTFTNTVFIFTLLSVMHYFFFSFKSESKIRQRVSDSGRWLMMVCFGAFFGSTVMARMALLVERLQFLLVDWFKVVRLIIQA